MAFFHSSLQLSGRSWAVSVHSSVNGHLGCFRVLAVVNSAAVTIRVYVSFRIIFLSSYMARSGTAGSYSISDFFFFF